MFLMSFLGYLIFCRERVLGIQRVSQLSPNLNACLTLQGVNHS